MVNDPIADLLVRIKNGGLVQKKEVKVPYSRVNEAILKVLSGTGYIEGYQVQEESGFKKLTIRLKYNPKSGHIIRGVKRVSKPGCHIYISSSEIRKVVRGDDRLGIISTSRGIISHRQARQQNLGGELLAIIW